MLPIILSIQAHAAQAIKALFEVEVSPADLQVEETAKHFEGDYTLVTFPLAKLRLGAPPVIADRIGKYLTEHFSTYQSYTAIQGFLNISLNNNEWKKFLIDHQHDTAESECFTLNRGANNTILIEYCSPNTNKPLHLGHVRNLILGDAITRIYAANGYQTVPVCLYNDRGTAICKSMYAWKVKYNGVTPAQIGKKSDKFVGDCYVAFSQIVEEELAAKGVSLKGLDKDQKEALEKSTDAHKAINEMLLKWEAGDPETIALWKQMNQWVYEANSQTFQRFGIDFQRFYYESEVYELGREMALKGLDEGVFTKDEKGNIGIDLTEENLDFKVLVRSNGTTLYMTQDLGLADKKYEEFRPTKSVYVVGNEQDYHFKVLFKIMQKLGKPYAAGMYHLSYGMVDLPTGKMKSREGTTVEAEDLMDEVIAKAKEETLKLGKTEGMDEAELNNLSRILGLGALKFFLAKVDPVKRMLFDPQESVDLHGQTGPFVQYAYTRTQSLKRQAATFDLPTLDAESVIEEVIHPAERSLIRMLYKYPQILTEAADTYNPAMIANYAYEVAKEYNRFYHECRVLVAEKPYLSAARFIISQITGNTLKNCLALLGIEVPERM